MRRGHSTPPTINRHQLKATLDAGEDIKLVMTVGGWTFRAQHIPGSLSFPQPALRAPGVTPR